MTSEIAKLPGKAIVTVSIPAFNRTDVLAEALRSLQSQTFTDFEVLISDNASTTDLRATINAFNDRRFHHYKHSESLGMLGNWRFSLTEPKTKYVAWLHDDDIWEPTHLEEAISHLEQNPEAGLYSCACDYFNNSGVVSTFAVETLADIKRPVVLDSNHSVCHWLNKQCSQCSSAVFRRTTLDQVFWGPKGLNYRCDYLLLAQAAIKGQWIYNPSVLVKYRIGDIKKHWQEPKKDLTRGVQGTYVIRYIAATSIESGNFDRTTLLNLAEGWSAFAKESFVMACGSLDSPAYLRATARMLVNEFPQTVSSGSVTRTMRLSAKLGLWYVFIADIANRLRSRWWPGGAQLPEPKK